MNVHVDQPLRERDHPDEGIGHQWETLLGLATDHVGEALYFMDQDARLLHVNAEACRSLGYAREELLGMRLFDIDPDISPDAWRDHWQRIAAGQSPSRQACHVTRAGFAFPVEIRTTQIRCNGKAVGLAVARDVTERQRAERELHFRSLEFRNLAEHSTDIIVRYDHECRRVYVNSTFCKLTGMAMEELLEKRPSDFAATPAIFAFEASLRAVMASGECHRLEYSQPTRNGRLLAFQVHLIPEPGVASGMASVLAIGRDISALKEGRQRVSRAEAMAHMGHWQWDYARKEARISAEMRRFLGQGQEWRPDFDELLSLLSGEDRDQAGQIIEAALDRKETEIAPFFHRARIAGLVKHFHTHVLVDYGADGMPCRLLGTTQDISELKHYESRLHELSFHDPLTGLPNRNLLTQQLSQSLADAARNGHILGLLALDLGRFKEITGNHGHDVGDHLLSESARRMRHMLRDYDMLARMGGDDFAILLPEVRTAADLGVIARKLLDALAQPFSFGNQELFVSASIGIAVYPSDGDTPGELLQFANSALHETEIQERSGYRFYSSELTRKSRERTALETALRRAEGEGELELYYQPKIKLTDGRLMGCEALLRWHHPSMGTLSPDRFIGIAEDTGLIVGIGAWALRQACLTAHEWNRDGRQELVMAVNLSPRQFRGNDMVATVRETLVDTGCEARWLELEITEGLLIGDDDGVQTALSALRDMGIRIAIDDFGTGYSALSYLRRFPIDVLKIDRSFISDVMLERDNTELVKAIIMMAHSLGLELVAEGIETASQEDFLRLHGCQFGQGYLYGKPTPKEAFAQFPSTPSGRLI